MALLGGCGSQQHPRQQSAEALQAAAVVQVQLPAADLSNRNAYVDPDSSEDLNPDFIDKDMINNALQDHGCKVV